MARCGSICCNRLGTKRQAWLGIMFGIVAACTGFVVFDLDKKLDLWLAFAFLLILPMNILATVLVVRNSCKDLTSQIVKGFLLGMIFTALLTIGLYYGVNGIKASPLALGALLPPWLFVMVPLSIHHLQQPQEPRAPQHIGLDETRSVIDHPPPAYVP